MLEKGFFDVPIKNKDETYKNINEMSKNNSNTSGDLLDYERFFRDYKLTTMFFIIEKSEETAFESWQNSVSMI